MKPETFESIRNMTEAQADLYLEFVAIANSMPVVIGDDELLEMWESAVRKVLLQKAISLVYGA